MGLFEGLVLLTMLGSSLYGAKQQNQLAKEQARAIREAAKPNPQTEALRKRMMDYYEAMLFAPSQPTPLLDQAKVKQENSSVGSYLGNYLSGYPEMQR